MSDETDPLITGGVPEGGAGRLKACCCSCGDRVKTVMGCGARCLPILWRVVLSVIQCFIQPLRVGIAYITPPDNVPAQHANVNQVAQTHEIKYDGSIGAAALSVFLLAVSFAIFIGEWCNKGKQVRPFQQWSSEILLVIGMFFGLAIIAVLFFLAFYSNNERRKRFMFPQAALQHEPISKRLIPILGLIIFYIGTLVLDISKVISYTECVSVFHSAGATFESDERKYTIAAFYHAFQTFFFLILLAFCCVSHWYEWHYYRRWQLRYALAWLAVVVLWAWFRSELHELDDLIYGDDVYHVRSGYVTAKQNMTDLCLHQDTIKFDKFESMAKLLYAFEIEFCLLVTECLFSLFFKMKALPNQDQNAQGHRVAGNGGDGQDSPGIQEQRRVGHDATSGRVIVCSVLTLGVSAIINIGYTFSVVLVKDEGNATVSDDTSGTDDMVYCTFRLIIWTSLLVSNLIAFHMTKNIKKTSDELSGLVKVMMVTTASFYIYGAFTMASSYGILSGSEPLASSTMERPTDGLATLTLIDSMFNVFGVFYQMLFIVHAMQLERNTTSYPYVIILTYLTITNMFVWGIDTFLEVQFFFLVERPQIYYLGGNAWRNIKVLTAPFDLFFRLNSVLILASLLWNAMKSLNR